MQRLKETINTSARIAGSMADLNQIPYKQTSRALLLHQPFQYLVKIWNVQLRMLSSQYPPDTKEAPFKSSLLKK
jgi:hypothetical protein